MRRVALGVCACLCLWVLCTSRSDRQPRVGTFNIRVFPSSGTDTEAVARRISELDADAFAVQEIADLGVLSRTLADASADSGRWWLMASTRYCAYDQLHLGVVYDSTRWRLVADRSYSTPKLCRAGHPSAYLAVLEAPDGTRFGLMSAHLQAGSEPRHYRRRRAQWKHLLRTLREAERELGVDIVLTGDFNSTGYTDNGGGEREFIDTALERAGLTLLTEDIECTMYWRPDGPSGDYAPATLDHVIARRPDRWARARPLGMCREHRCQRRETLPEWHTVSDHCPIVAGGQ